MAFLDHIDPGNAGGSVPIPEPVRHYQENKEPQHHACPYCDLVFTNADEMHRHRVEAHPTRRPVLTVAGHIHRRQELVITEPLADGELKFDEVDAVLIDGKSYDPVEAEDYLKEQKSGFFDVRIQHQSYEVIHKLHFHIVDSDDLRRVDDCFYEIFSTKLALKEQLSAFHLKVDELPKACRYYGGGLASYVTGLIIKDKLDNSLLRTVGYLDKFGEAEDKLASYNRALAQSILAIIRFIRNDFRPQPGDHYLPALDGARSVFRTGKFQSVRCQSAKGNAAVPIDNATETLVESSLSLPKERESSWHAVENLYQAKSIPEEDRHKAGFLLWLNARYCGFHATQKDLERVLKYSPSFRHILTELESSE